MGLKRITPTNCLNFDFTFDLAKTIPALLMAKCEVLKIRGKIIDAAQQIIKPEVKFCGKSLIDFNPPTMFNIVINKEMSLKKSR